VDQTALDKPHFLVMLTRGKTCSFWRHLVEPSLSPGLRLPLTISVKAKNATGPMCRGIQGAVSDTVSMQYSTKRFNFFFIRHALHLSFVVHVSLTDGSLSKLDENGMGSPSLRRDREETPKIYRNRDKGDGIRIRCCLWDWTEVKMLHAVRRCSSLLSKDGRRQFITPNDVRDEISSALPRNHRLPEDVLALKKVASAFVL
jgi:hypothetical protein